MRRRLRLSLLSALATCALSAHADTLTFAVGGGYTGTVTVTTGAADPYATGGYSVISGSGVIDGQDVTLEYDPAVNSQNDLGGFDNVLYVEETPLLDVAGLEFETVTANPGDGSGLNIFYDSTAQFGPVGYDIFQFPAETFTPITFTQVAATPEPSSFVLLGTGVLGVVGAARRRWMQR